MRRLSYLLLALTTALSTAGRLPALAWQAEPSPRDHLATSAAPLAGPLVGPITSQGAEASTAPAKEARAEEKQAAVVETQAKQPLNANTILKGNITQQGTSPLLLEGVQQELPKGTQVELNIMGHLNSEISQKGDEVWCRISHDVPGSGGVSVPGGWFAHGLVTQSKGQGRQGRNGFVEVEFDKLVGPDGETEVPFKARLTTKDAPLTSVAKQVVRESTFVGIGAASGSLAAVQLGGIPAAIASHGMTVAVGAGVGAGIGVIAAYKNKGAIRNFLPGDSMKLVVDTPIVLPGFNPKLLPSAKPVPVLHGMDISIDNVHFGKLPNGDKSACMLQVGFTMKNRTAHEYSFRQLSVLSDNGERYYPDMFLNAPAELAKRCQPNSTLSGLVNFNVDGKKHKYWLQIFDKTKETELTRFPIN
jgi:hypothetical protein